MTKLKSITLGNYVWLAVEYKGKIMPLYKMGRVGDCIGPGFRMHE